MISALDHEKQAGYEPVKYTLADGHVFDLLSPNSDELWQLLEKNILDAAELSQKLPILGVFLDFKVYARPLSKYWPGHLYSISYDRKILKEFAESEKIEIPQLKPSQRRTWLESKKLVKKFETFQIKSWQKRMKDLRKKVDAINPKFQFAVYPASYTLFVNSVVWKELSTRKAPLLIGEHYTYAKDQRINKLSFFLMFFLSVSR